LNSKGYYWNGRHQTTDVLKCNGSSCTIEKVPFKPELKCQGRENQLIGTGFNFVFCGYYNGEAFLKPLYDMGTTVKKGENGETVTKEEDSYFTEGRDSTGSLFPNTKKYYALKNEGHALILDEAVGNVFVLK